MQAAPTASSPRPCPNSSPSILVAERGGLRGERSVTGEVEVLRGLAMKHLFCVLMALGLLVGLARHAHAQPTYSFTTLDVPGALVPVGSRATGINDSGQIVGGARNGFLLDQGSYTTIDPPGSTGGSIASGINDSGQIVGYYAHF